VTAVALALVLTSALSHATWNLLAKRAAGAPVSFTWLFTLVSFVVCVPLAARTLIVDRPHIGLEEVGLIVGSGAFHLGYFLALGRGYKYGDLTLVYPIARGTGPWLATLGALVFLGESPSGAAWLGVALVAGGVLVLAGNPGALVTESKWHAVAYALLTGAFIGAYTVWDRIAVGERAIPPILYFWGMCLSLLVFLGPFAIRARLDLIEQWRTRWHVAVAIGVLSSVSYVLMLSALAVSPVSFVAPIRETSVLFASVLGARFLAEEGTVRRLIAASAMVLGVIVLALS
jgi:drug/metabolite transporter (DMT)-like permease